ncbi:hypothetical protein JNW91_15730 [Micromonospora sp. STR1_7]|uniref:ATP/GTP-binding protein n=1 Tax=Micromonospora parastrephiae TaxID=2806101 RepID=A0ABS1XV90_9ACTN|nr:hypothetical protein [Micromonospora parastrephiae]MBM0233185.1 hypothetical protein [Micromonospora parastrephiae]
MTINDAMPDPMEDPEQIGQALGEAFDLVDEIIDGVTDAEIEQRLRQLLADTAMPAGGADLNNLDSMLRGPGWDVSSRLDLADMIGPDSTALPGVTVPEVWEEMHCVLRNALEQLVDVRAAADAARREATEQLAVAAAAQRQAEEVTAGVNAYVDAALDQAKHVLAEARAEAARLTAEAKLQAEETRAAARSRAVPTDMLPIASARSKARYLVVAGPVGSGKTALFATTLRALMRELDNDVHSAPLPSAKFGVLPAPIHWHRRLRSVEPLLPSPATNGVGYSALTGWVKWLVETPPASFPDLNNHIGAGALLVYDDHFDALSDVDVCSEDRPTRMGVGNQSGTAQRCVAHIKPYVPDADWGREAPEQPLLVLMSCLSVLDDRQPALPGLDADALINCEHRQPAAALPSDDDSTPARNNQPEVYQLSTKK